MTELNIPTPEDMRDQILDDLYLGAVAAGVADPPIALGSDWYNLATGCGNCTAIVNANVALSDDDWDPRSCSDARLEQWRITLGLPVVNPTGAVGNIVARLPSGSANLADKTRFTLNGLRYHTIGALTGVVDGQEVPAQADDTGTVTDAAGGTKVYWVSTPSGFQSWAEVSKNVPLSGGTDAEDTEHKRDRVLTRMGNPPGGGNWAQLRERAMNALSSVQAYVYPALGGPSSVLVALTKSIDPVLRDWSRSPTTGMLQIVRSALWTNESSADKVVVRAVAEQPIDVSLNITIPDAASSGGNGMGWVNDTPWPALVGGDNGRATVTAVTDSKTFTISAQTTTSPVAGLTYVDWWSPGDQKFYRRLITIVGGSSGAWVVTVDQPCVDQDNNLIAVGDFISPACVNADAYGSTWRDIMAKLGPGECTALAYRLPRASRHPLTTSQDNPTLTTVQKKDFLNAFDEVTDCAYAYTSTTTPAVPASVDTPPNVLTLDNFGIYKL